MDDHREQSVPLAWNVFINALSDCQRGSLTVSAGDWNDALALKSFLNSRDVALRYLSPVERGNDDMGRYRETFKFCNEQVGRKVGEFTTDPIDWSIPYLRLSVMDYFGVLTQ